MATFFNVTAHELTSEQIHDIFDTFGIENFFIVDVPAPVIDPMTDIKDVEEIAKSLIHPMMTSRDVAMVAGEPTFVCAMVKELQRMGIKCVAATTKRESVEKTLPDGSVIKQNVFKHVRFREFPSLIG